MSVFFRFLIYVVRYILYAIRHMADEILITLLCWEKEMPDSVIALTAFMILILVALAYAAGQMPP